MAGLAAIRYVKVMSNSCSEASLEIDCMQEKQSTAPSDCAELCIGTQRRMEGGGSVPVQELRRLVRIDCKSAV